MNAGRSYLGAAPSTGAVWLASFGRERLAGLYIWHAVACCHHYFEVRAYLTITWAYKPVSPQLWR